MFQTRSRQSGFVTAFNLLELIYHATVRNLRQSHGNAVLGLFFSIMQSVMFMAVFYIMFEVLEMRGLAVRGDFILYLMSGIFLFMTHTKALGAIVGAETSTSTMMQHAPMNTVVSITAAALGSLYNQVLSACVILGLYYCLGNQFVIIDPIGAMAMFLVAWGSGCAIGLVFLSAKPWLPGFVGIASMVYQRANMIASGKMFLANTLPPSRLALFSWNPLFHSIDQSRGYIFINYEPHNTSLMYPIVLSLVLVTIGLMAEFYTRRHASQSWGAKR